MLKKRPKIIKRWFLEGPNRYGDHPSFRIEVPARKVSRNFVLMKSKKLSLDAKDMVFSTKSDISSWMFSVKTLTRLAGIALEYHEHSAIQTGNVFVVFRADSAEIGNTIACEAAAWIN